MTNAGTLTLLLAGSVALLLVGAALAAVPMGGTSGKMRERVRRATGLDAQPVAEVATNIRVTAADERRPLRRLVEALGYNPELPPAFAASVPLVVTAAAAAGLLAFWRVGSS